MGEREWGEEIDEALARELEEKFGASGTQVQRRGKVELKDLLSRCVDETLASGDVSSRAARAWAEAAGEVGSRHTRGIYVREGEGGALPTLIVYLDGHSFVYEFATDHLLYEQRMAYLGFPVEAIEFRLSNRQAPSRPAPVVPIEHARAARAGATAPAKADDAPLSAFEEAWAKGLVDDLPGPLADAILGAMRASRGTEGD